VLGLAPTRLVAQRPQHQSATVEAGSRAQNLAALQQPAPSQPDAASLLPVVSADTL